MKRALVFSGGGSRGSYEVGAWQALNQLGLKLDIVCGSSIGAINAALAAQGDVDLARSLWDNIDASKVLSGDAHDFAVAEMIHGGRDIIPFLMQNSTRLFRDAGPLRELLDRHLDERRIRASGMRFGAMALRLPSLTRAELFLDEQDNGSLISCIMASCACFPVFPPYKFGQSSYLDGGYIDNLPIDMAVMSGADEIIAVDVHPDPVHPEYALLPNVAVVHPLESLGDFIDFDPVRLARNRRMGYLDAMKLFGRLDGFRYSFVKPREIWFYQAAREFACQTARFDSIVMSSHGFYSSRSAKAPLSSIISVCPSSLNWREQLIRGLEIAAEVAGFRRDSVYDFIELARLIYSAARKNTSHGGIESARRSGGLRLIGYLLETPFTSLPEGWQLMLQSQPGPVAAAICLKVLEKYMGRN